MTDTLQKLYYDPTTGLTGINKLYERAREHGYTREHVKDFLSKQEAYQITAPQRQPKPLRIVADRPYSYQIDLMFFEAFKRQNHGYVGLFNAIEITTRYAHSIPIKSKSQAEVNRAFDEFYAQTDYQVQAITCDNEPSFRKCLSRYPFVQVFYAQPGEKTQTGMIERFNRTIRELINNYQTAHNTANYVDALSELLKNYNTSVHTSINAKPVSVIHKPNKTDKLIKSNQSALVELLDEHASRMTYSTGDKVRAVKNKSAFEKGSETFTKTVYEIVGKEGNSYVIKGPGGVNKRLYKHYELKKVDKVESQTLSHVSPASTAQRASIDDATKQHKFMKRQARAHLGTDGSSALDEHGNIVQKPRLQPKNEKRRYTQN